MQVKALSFLLLASSSVVLAAPRGGGRGGFGGHAHGADDAQAGGAGAGGNGQNNAVDAGNGAGAGNAGNAGGNAGNAGNAGGNAGNGNAGGNAGNAGNAGGNANEGIVQAAQNWQADTNIVSNFLSTGGSLSGQQLTDAASKALAAEKDELNHKAVLDAAFGKQDTNIVDADNTLAVSGTFQYVVDQLDNLAQNGSTFSNAQVKAVIAAINNDRCPQVLPSIDAYLQKATADQAQQLSAIRPNNCPPVADSRDVSGGGNNNAGGNAGNAGNGNAGNGNAGNAGNAGGNAGNAGTGNAGAGNAGSAGNAGN